MATQPMPEPEDESPGGAAMSDEELARHLEEHETRAISHYDTEIAAEQASAIDRYYRRPYGDERDGKSSVVDGTVAITVDNALAAVLKPFVSADETVTFQPRSQEDEEVAGQATEYVNYVLHNDNCGFLVLHDWFKDALLCKLGVVKAYWEDYSTSTPVRLDSLDPMQLQMLQQQEQVIDGPFGPDDNGLYSLDVMHTEKGGKLCIANVPPEEYRISPFARPGHVPPYEAHVTRKSKSELISMGFDRKVVDALSRSDNSGIDDSRALARRADETWAATQQDTTGTEANTLVDFNDEFALIDYDGDGKAELRRVMRSGNVILYNEEVEYGLFAKLCPAPMPHKIYGLGLADQVSDEQRIKTVLWRQTLDNLYLSNNPRPVLGDKAERSDGTTIDDLLSDAPGAVIRVQDATQLGNFSVPFVADKSFPMLEYVSQQAESRTGISLHGQGMDPDALGTAGQITATQAAIMEDGRNSRSEMIARIFAETGVKDLFKLMLKLLVAHQPRSRMIRLRNKWVEVDPRDWNADMDVSIAVGLGMGSKAEQITTAQTVLATMETLGASPYGSLIDAEKVYNAVKKLFTATGIKNVDDFLNEPQRGPDGQLQQPPPPPDPKMMVAQSQMQIGQMKAQNDIQLGQAKAANDAQSAQHDAWLKQVVAQNQAQLDAAKANTEAQLGAMRLHMQQQLDAIQMGHDMHIEETKVAHAHELGRVKAEGDAKLAKFRAGGDLSK